MTNDIDISLVGDEELLRTLQQLDYKLQQRVLKKVLSDAARNTIVKELKRESPVGSTGNLQRSMGVVPGKSKKNAVVFAGPRMGGNNKGYVANIIEHSKEQYRVNKPDTGKKAMVTPWGGIYRRVKPMKKRVFVKPAIEGQLQNALNHIIKSTRKIIERAIKRQSK